MNARGVDFTGIAMLLGLGVAVFVGYRVYKSAPSFAKSVSDAAGAAAETVGNAAGVALDVVKKAVEEVTPTNPNNVFNRTFQPIADMFIKGGSPDEDNGAQVLSRFTAGDQEDADIGAAIRALQRRPDRLMTTADQDDADLGRAMAEYSGAAFVDYSKLSRGVFK